jgi:hypothetical protein
MNAAKWYMRQVPFFKKWLNISSMPGQFYMLDLQHAKYNVHSMGVSGIKIFLPLKTIDRFESIQALIWQSYQSNQDSGPRFFISQDQEKQKRSTGINRSVSGDFMGITFIPEIKITGL